MAATRADVRRKLAGSRPAGTMGAGRMGAGMRPRSEWAYLLGETPGTAAPVPAASESDALALPPFGRGVALLANAIASTAWHATRYDPDLGVSVKIPDQPAVVRDPDPTATPWGIPVGRD